MLCCITRVADILRLKAVSAGVVVVKGERTGRYLAMNKNGRLYGAVSVSSCSLNINLSLAGKTEHKLFFIKKTKHRKASLVDYYTVLLLCIIQ